VDLAGVRGAGRGAYLCAKMECWETARRRRSLSRALGLGAVVLDQERLAESLAGMIPGPPTSPAPRQL